MAKVGFRKGAKMERVGKALDDPRAALNQIGIVMVGESQEAFEQQKFGRTNWRPRAPVNVFGILADLAANRAISPQRFQTRPALQDTGTLAASITHRVTGNTVTVGTNIDYADKHHRGLTTESVTITEDIQERLWEWLQGDGGDRKDSLGWLLNRKYTGTKLTMKLPRRPIVGITDQTRADVKEIVGVKIFEAK